MYKCPFCKKTSEKKWIIINHIRQSKSGDHGPMGDLPEGFNPETLEVRSSLNPDVEPSPPNEDKAEVNPGGNVNSKVELINPPIRKKIEILVCPDPDCNTPKSEWINIDQVEDATEEQKRVYDYVCPNCKELIRLDRGKRE